jgi:hypothetical protein
VKKKKSRKKRRGGGEKKLLILFAALLLWNPAKNFFFPRVLEGEGETQQREEREKSSCWCRRPAVDTPSKKAQRAQVQSRSLPSASSAAGLPSNFKFIDLEFV